MATNQPTKYQRDHRPVRIIEIQCQETARDEKRCVACGRWPLKSHRPHKPNAIGSLGYVAHYADGSKVTLTLAEIAGKLR